MRSTRAASSLARLGRDAAERALARASGGGLVGGNAVRVLNDASENFPAWLAAIEQAQHTIHLENYIFDDDTVGRRFAAALADRARDGVTVRVLLDWFGAATFRNRGVRRLMRAAGVDVRAFNPPRIGNPLRWFSRDHRKLLTVDHDVAFVSGLCVSAKWTGSGAGAENEWRDAGVEIRGPALAPLSRAFADTWRRAGAPLPENEIPAEADIRAAGDVGVRVIAASPSQVSVYQLDQLVASLATQRLWLADAYFVGLSLYVQTLRAAAQDGVDVRLLVPGTSDIPVVRFVGRIGYRPLLEAGVRIFEWNGPMMHAKMAVADGRWARVGSTNLNVSSWISNWELDVAIEDERLAGAMEQRYEADLANATEIVLRGRHFRRTARAGERRRYERASGTRGGRAAAGALRFMNRIARRRVFEGPSPALFLAAGVLLIGVGLLALIEPLVVAIPAALVATWAGGTFVISGLRRWVRRSRYSTPSA
jgi:cardiolipin synthase A/B